MDQKHAPSDARRAPVSLMCRASFAVSAKRGCGQYIYYTSELNVPARAIEISGFEVASCTGETQASNS